MLKYTCQCMNVSFETTTSSSSLEKKNDFIKSIESLLLSDNLNDSNKKIDYLKCFVQNSEFCVETKTNKLIDLLDTNHIESINTCWKIKFPLLIGYSVQTDRNSLFKFKLNKCLICNTFTHLLVVTQSDINASVNLSSNSANNTSSNHNGHNLSHSSANFIESTTNIYNVYVLVNTDQVKLVDNLEVLKNSDYYSHLYDIVLKENNIQKRNKSENDIFDLDFQINMESEIVKKVFLNRIEDSYVQQQQSKTEVNDSSIEKSNAASSDETFKNNFLDLVNSLLSNGATQQTVNSDKVKIKPKELNILKGGRVRKYDNENILSSSVFEMEELEELGSNEHFVSDEDASNEEETTTTTTGLEDNSNMLENIKKNVLKKRNSNVDEDLNNPIEKSGHFSIGLNKKYNKDLLSNKYSCSLPRDIPVMHHGSRMSTIKNIVNQSSEEENRADNENQYFNNNEKVDHQKRHKSRVNMTTVNNRQIQSMSTSYKNQNDDESESSPNNNNDLYEGDDELFEDDHNNNLTKTDRLDDDGDDETNTKNMGQAISNLASSIVLKDGRELFGGVPSRRVPINSISKSCFE